MQSAAEAFEALFVRELLKAARVSGATGEWQDLIERHMADAAARGAPFGFAAALFPAAGTGEAR
jgi:Rod binding domain-containing protein